MNINEYLGIPCIPSHVGDGCNLLTKESELEQEMKQTCIFHYMNCGHFLDMLQKKRNYLANISNWPDVYEGYLSMLSIVDCDCRNIIGSTFGQCWSFEDQESELLWKAYRQDGERDRYDTVRIETTVWDLAHSIMSLNPWSVGFPAAFVRLSAVQYWHEEDLLSQEHIQAVADSWADVQETLFQKRMQFKNEKEIRLIINEGAISQFPNSAFVEEDGLVSYPLEPNNMTMFRSVLCHPQMEDARVDEIRRVAAVASWNIQYINKSDLYQLPRQWFRLVN